MPNKNLSDVVTCPNCNEARAVRRDVIARVTKAGKPLICKPCHNRMRFDDKDHPTKGTGVRNNKELFYTRVSFYQAKKRCKMGKEHHPCYENVDFKFKSLQELVDCIGVRPRGMSIDRIDPLGHYEPNNVRWATVLQQAQNRMPRNYWKNKLQAC